MASATVILISISPVVFEVTIIDPELQSEIFNKYFNSTFTRSSFILPPIVNLPTPVSQLSKIAINSTDVCETLFELDTSKAPGGDGISPAIFKQFILS